jgi:hypothetical protein
MRIVAVSDVHLGYMDEGTEYDIPDKYGFLDFLNYLRCL